MKEKVRRALRALLSCFRTRSRRGSVLQCPKRLDGVQEGIDAAGQLALDLWRCPDTDWVESPATKRQQNILYSIWIVEGRSTTSTNESTPQSTYSTAWYVIKCCIVDRRTRT